MFRLFKNKKGQSTLEYAIIIMIVIAALLTMQNWVKRGISGRLKSSADDIGDQFSVGNTNGIKSTATHSVTQETFGIEGQGVSKSAMLANEVTNSVDKQQIVNVDKENWGGN